MYIAVVPNRTSPPAILLREGYREGGKVKTRTLANLSKLPPPAIEAIRAALKGEKLVTTDQLVEILPNGSPAHGHVDAVLRAMKRVRFDKLIASPRCRERDLVVAMVAARILAPKPKSKLATTRWWHDTTLPDLMGVADADENDLYAAMDWLLERQNDIENRLASRHLEKDALALYDLSSSYFEGASCPLAALGHNRDGKKGKLQVNYGLLTNQAGVPISVSVFEGNTADSTTLMPLVNKVSDEFGVSHFVLVGDRGMITQTQIDALRELEQVDWITALRTEAIRKLTDSGHVQMDLFDQRNLFEIEEHDDFPGERLVACRNPALARRRAEKRRALIAATVAELQQVQRMVQRGRLQGKDTIGDALDKAIGSSKMRRHVRFDVRDDGFDMAIDKDSVVAEATRTTIEELDRVKRQITRGSLTGKEAIGQRVSKVLARRKVSKHIRVEIHDDGLDVSIDGDSIVDELMGPLLRKLQPVRKRLEQGQLHGQDAIGVRVGRVINKYKMAKHFLLDIHDDHFDFTIDEANVAAEAALDGIYVVRTSLPKEQMDSDETVRSYKALTKVERAFRTLKTIDIRVRPIHHNLESRVRAHIFLCMLAYYVEWHMIEAWRPLLFCDEDQAAKATRDPVAPAKRSKPALHKAASKRLEDGSAVHSFETLLDHLGAIVRNTCRRGGAGDDEPTFHMLTPPNHTQQRAYDLLATIKA